MFRTLGCAMAAFVLSAGIALAADITGKVKSVNADKNTLTITVDDKDQIITVAKDAKIQHSVGKKAKKAVLEDVSGGLKGLTVGKEVTVTTEKKDDKEVATSIKVDGLDPKKKKKAK